MALRVRDLDERSFSAWDGFVAQCPEASFFHRAGWGRVIRSAFGQNPHYLYAERDGQVIGVLPLVHMRSRLFGNRLVSTPFNTVGGVAAMDEEARAALEAEAARRMHALGARYVELRQPPRLHPHGGEWMARHGLYATFERPVPADDAADMKMIPGNKRRDLKKALQSGLEVGVDAAPDRFYPVFAETMRNLGTPVYGARYFRAIAATFGKDCDFMVVSHQGQPVAASMNFWFRDRVILNVLGNLPSARPLNASSVLIWSLSRRAAERGRTLFDFGRSKVGSGNESFKSLWGFTGRPIANEFLLAEGSAMPELNVKNPKFSRFIEAWKKLPLPVANVMGPALIRHIG